MEAQRTDTDTSLSGLTIEDERGDERARWGLQLRAATCEIDRLTRKLDEQAEDIARLTRIVFVAQERIATLESVADSFRVEVASRFGKAILSLHQSLSTPPTSALATDKLAALIVDAGLFDGAWYLQRYPDVASAGVDPLQHYILHGNSEGREPRDFPIAQGGA